MVVLTLHVHVAVSNWVYLRLPSLQNKEAIGHARFLLLQANHLLFTVNLEKGKIQIRARADYHQKDSFVRDDRSDTFGIHSRRTTVSVGL